MHDINAIPGTEKKWMKNGKLEYVFRCFKKRRARGRHGKTKTNTVFRILTADEYEAEKLTQPENLR